MTKEVKLQNPTCGHCNSCPMNTGTQIIPTPNGMTFANIFCAHCGISIGVCFLGLAQQEGPRIVKPS